MKLRTTLTIKLTLSAMLVVSVLFSSCISQRKVKLLQERTAKIPTEQFENPKNV